MSAGAVLIRRQRRIMRRFRDAVAASPDVAVSLDSHGVRRSLACRRLIARGVLVETVEGLRWLDEGRAGALHTSRRNVSIIVAFVLVLLLVAALLTAW
jgi:uncharacterized membrane protein YidH (DUF202 family)